MRSVRHYSAISSPVFPAAVPAGDPAGGGAAAAGASAPVREARRPGPGPADQAGLGAQGQRLQHVAAAAHAAVEHHGNVGAGLDNARQHAQWCDRAGNPRAW